MKPEAQRIAIAEACGIRPEFYTNKAGQWVGCPDIPDYLNDLNAMHEAEKALKEEDREEYHRRMWLVTRPDSHDMWVHNWTYTHATAAQRAEAFLRTIGKWVDKDSDTRLV